MKYSKLTFEDLRPLTAGLPPVALFSSADYGGPGISAMDLFKGLRKAGVNASMTVMSQRGPHMEGLFTATLNGKPVWPVHAALNTAALRHHPGRKAGYEMFSLNRSALDTVHFGLAKNAGLVHLHWVAGLLSSPQALSVLQNKPVLWTLHDMNPFTGGCHYSAGCEKYMNGGCKNCPQLGVSSSGRDIAAESFAAKRAGYATLNLHLVTLSRPFDACVQASLALGDFSRTIIPNSVDVNTFSPTPQAEARAGLGLPADKKVVVFCASKFKRRNKGLHVLLQALNFLCAQRPDMKLLLLLIGRTAGETLAQGYECRSLGIVENMTELARAYSAADLYATPAFEEAFGRMTAESQACGTPGTGFRGTGAEDIIQDGVTGYLAQHPGLPLKEEPEPDDGEAYAFIKNPDAIKDLAFTIQKILNLPVDEYQAMRESCREHALRHYTPQLQTLYYLQLYRRLLCFPEITLSSACHKYRKNNETYATNDSAI